MMIAEVTRRFESGCVAVNQISTECKAYHGGHGNDEMEKEHFINWCIEAFLYAPRHKDDLLTGISVEIIAE